MYTLRQSTSLAILFILSLTIPLADAFVVGKQVETEYTPHDLMISGLIDHPINLSYSDVQRFPMVSEVALMKCVGGWTQLYNWTGIPLFFLLSATGVKANATEVVFYALDGFSSSLTIERALNPTTLLALQANGTVLSHADGYPYRLVVPCKYGYKWVKYVTAIEVVDYDYKGYYESLGYSDEADIPDCTLPSTTRSFETYHIELGNTTQTITTLSNSAINSFDFDMARQQLSFEVTESPGTTGYFLITIPKELLWCEDLERWQVWANNMLKADREAMRAGDYTFIGFTYNYSIHTIKILAATATDTTVPTISILSPENRTYITSFINLSLAIDEATSWVGYSLDGQMNLTAAVNTTLSGLLDGSHSLTVYANDTVGNTGASEIVYFSVETHEPEPFPVWTVAIIVMIVMLGTTILVYYTKGKEVTERARQ